MLASDVDNPEFVNPIAPESLLHVEFYDHAALDTWETEKSGIKKYKPECPFIRIAIPGNDKLTIERPADNHDVKKYPKQWLWYQMQTGKIANAENVPGWQLEEWSELNADQARQLKFLRFYTVEQIAGANDVQIQGIGMGGQGLRERAKIALATRNSSIASSEIQKRDARIAELESQVKRVLELVEAKAVEVPKRKGGRPKKVKPEEHASQ